MLACSFYSTGLDLAFLKRTWTWTWTRLLLDLLQVCYVLIRYTRAIADFREFWTFADFSEATALFFSSRFPLISVV